MKRYCHLCGAQYQEKLQNPWYCTGCKNISYANPSPTVLLFLFNDAGELLIAERAIEPFKGMDSLPGGFVDEGETLEEALERELAEELGLVASDYTAPQYVTSITESYPFSREVKVVLPALFTAKIMTHKPVEAHDDVARVRFVDLGNIDTVNFSRPILKTIATRAYDVLSRLPEVY